MNQKNKRTKKQNQINIPIQSAAQSRRSKGSATPAPRQTTRRQPSPRISEKQRPQQKVSPRSQAQRPAMTPEEEMGRAAARAAHGRRHQRRRAARRRLYTVMLMILALGGGIIFCLTFFFNVQNIEIQGDNPYSAEQVEEASGSLRGRNIFLLKPAENEEAILKALPYIDSAAITRALPNTVTITVTRAEPELAIEVGDGQYAVVSARGRVLEIGGSPPEGLVKILGMTASAAPGEHIQFEDKNDADILTDLTNALKENNLKQSIVWVDFSNLLDIQAFYDNRLILQMGSPTDFDAKLRMARAAIDQKVPEGKTGRIVLTADEAILRID